MSQPKKRKEMRLIGSFLALGVAAVTATGTILVSTRSNTALVKVPVASTSIGEGDRITSNSITYVNIHPNAITDKLITNPNDLINNYVLRNTSAGEYFYADYITTNIKERLADKVVYTAVPVPVNQQIAVNTEIKEDDFVFISIIAGSSSDDEYYTTDIPTVQILEPDQLSAVRVLAVLDSSGHSVTDKKEALEDSSGNISLDESLPQASMLVLDCNGIQRALLLQAMNVGKIQISILPEKLQEEYRQKWFADASEEVTSDMTTLTDEQIADREDELEQQLAELEQLAQMELQQKIQAQADELGITYEEAYNQFSATYKTDIEENINGYLGEDYSGEFTISDDVVVSTSNNTNGGE